ncbi:DNA topoisomerase VI subunit B [Candidatus Micrarchaeota archaeon]|nr:MAG: DNA topoisomerase VI subunit B [Candidatus Micrarchaeota archaeon]
MARDNPIFNQFREHSVAEFFRKNRQMLGFSGKVRSLTTIVHEYVTNSLDACEEAGILPDIGIEIRVVNGDHCVVRASDNGPGIPQKLVGKALGMMLAGTKFHRYMQQRGQQGIGAAGCTMFALITTGTPVKVRTGTGTSKVYSCDLSIDVKTNKPKMLNEKMEEGEMRGLEIEGEFGEVKYDKGEYGPLAYLKRTAIANPHAQIKFKGPNDEEVLFPRASDAIPERPKEVLPHPLGLTTSDLVEMAHHSKDRKISSFLMNNFTRVSSGKIGELRGLLPDVNLNAKPRNLAWADAEKMIDAFSRLRWIAPATDSIRPIGEEQVKKALVNILNPEFMSVRERKPKVFRGGVPFVVETAITYGGNSGRHTQSGVSGDVIRFANRAPLLFDAGGCAITQAVKEMDWNRYGMKEFDSMPITVFVNFVSVHVPYTGAGKQAIANEEEIVGEIKLSVMECARELQSHLRGKVRAGEKEAKKKAIMRYVDQLAKDLVELSGTGDVERLKKKLVKLVEGKYKKKIEDATLEEIAGEAAAAQLEAENSKNEGES